MAEAHRNERKSACWRSQRGRVEDAGRGREWCGALHASEGRRSEFNHGHGRQCAAAHRRAVTGVRRSPLAMALIATAIGIGRRGMLAVTDNMSGGRQPASLMRVAHDHPAWRTVHRRHGKNQPRQPRQCAKAWRACKVAKRAAHRRSLSAARPGLNSGAASIRAPARPGNQACVRPSTTGLLQSGYLV